jgi:hypothetical protein
MAECACLSRAQHWRRWIPGRSIVQTAKTLQLHVGPERSNLVAANVRRLHLFRGRCQSLLTSAATLNWFGVRSLGAWSFELIWSLVFGVFQYGHRPALGPFGARLDEPQPLFA